MALKKRELRAPISSRGEVTELPKFSLEQVIDLVVMQIVRKDCAYEH